MIMDLRMAQCAVKMCSVHAREELDMFCRDCVLQICEKCAQKDHRHHRFTNLAKYARQKRAQLKMTKANVRHIQCPEIDKILQNIADIKLSNIESSQHEIDKIQQQKDHIIHAVTCIANRHTSLCQERLQELNEKLEKTSRKYKEYKELIMDQTEYLESNESTMSNFDFIERDQTLQGLIKTIDRPDLSGMRLNHVFSKGSCNFKVLDNYFGHFGREHKSTPTSKVTMAMYDPVVAKISSFQLKTKMLGSISPITDDTAMVCNTDTKSLQLYTSGGEAKLTKEIGELLNDCALVNGEDVLVVTCPHSFSVKKVSISGTFSTIRSTSPLIPVGVSVTLSADVLVTMCDEYSKLFDIVNTKSKVLVISMGGEIQKTFEFADGNTRLFTGPIRAVQNYNTDICVTDKTGETRGVVHILYDSGRQKSRYTGHKDTSAKFYPTDICCDYNCHIIVADGYKKVHLLNPDGQYLKLLLTPQTGLSAPWSLGLCNDRLWVGCSDSRISLFKYSF